MIISFYSYKGGVGRTMLIANLAGYFAYKEGSSVLLVDLDLESPGLHYYFGKTDNDIKTDGIIEIFTDYVQQAQRLIGELDDDGKILDKENPPLPSRNNIIPLLNNTTKKGGRIDLLAGGNYSQNYKERVINFHWKEFYQDLAGDEYIEYALKDALKYMEYENEKIYDYIFVDTRTGIGDYQDIFNIQLASANVIVTTSIKQSLEGSKRIIDAILSSPYVTKGIYRGKGVLPILSRVDTSVNEKIGVAKDAFRNTFRYLFTNENESFIDKYLDFTLVDYKRDLSFSENMVFVNSEERIEKESIQSSYSNISKLIKEHFKHGKSMPEIINKESSNDSQSLTTHQTKGSEGLSIDDVLDNMSKANYTLLIDFSESMLIRDEVENKSRIEAAALYSERLAKYFNTIDSEDGIDIYAFNTNFKHYLYKDDVDLKNVFKQEKPMGKKNLFNILEKAISIYKNRNQRPEVIFILTDGENIGEQEKIKKFLIDTTLEVRRGHLGISFIQFGQNEEGKAFFEFLDNQIINHGAKQDIIDHKTYQEAEKMQVYRLIVHALLD